jgi:hypothetical protein
MNGWMDGWSPFLQHQSVSFLRHQLVFDAIPDLPSLLRRDFKKAKLKVKSKGLVVPVPPLPFLV